MRYARKRNATKIVVGKPTHARWRDILKPSFLDDLVRRSLEIDVYVISGGAERPPAGPSERRPADARETSGYFAGAAVVASSAVASWLFFGRAQLADVVMVFLLGVVVVSMRFGYGPSLLAALLSVLTFDFIFIPPYMSFAVTDYSHVVTFVVMLFVALVISNLTQRIRAQADSARGRERRTASLYAVSRELGTATSRDALVEVAARHVRELFGVKVALLLPKADRKLEIVHADEGTLDAQEKDVGVAEWAWQNHRPAGAGTDTLPLARGRFVPLLGSRGAVGVLALYPPPSPGSTTPTTGSCFTPSVGSSASPSSGRSSRRRRVGPPCASRQSSFATLFSARSRTICARRSASSPARRARCSRRTCPSPRRRGASSCRRRTKRRSGSRGSYATSST